MKKMVFTIFGMALFISSNAFAIELIISKNKNMECAKISNVDENIGNTQNVHNSYRSSNQRALSNYNTTVEIWTSTEGALSGCVKDNDWEIYSNYSPGNNEWVVAFGANCKFEKAATVQFTFNTANFAFLDKPDNAFKSMEEFEFTYYTDFEAVKNESPKKITKKNVHLGELKADRNSCYEVNVR